MKHFLIVIPIVLLACSGQQEPETISLEDLAGETGGEEILMDTTKFDFISLPANVARFVQGQLDLYDTASHENQHPIDRFGYSTRQKFDFFNKSILPEEDKSALKNPSARFYYYTFADTTSTKNAFYNWLDCFGQECLSVKLNEDVEKAQIAPMFALVYDTCIVAAEYQREYKKNDWKSFQDSLVAGFGRDYNYRIDVAYNGSLKWKPAQGH